ncbi:MAG: NUDIX domain-containing protein [Prolixibacteraceae bacterium]|jgi:mutator protein MutT|nr:NUDIX domain-containing protein [Prolixibacteraceae bacterium]
MYSETHPSRVFKFCPKCGSSEFKVTGPRSFRCSNCSFEFYVNSAAAVAALIFNAEGKMLFTRRAVDPDKGELDLPGGFVDPMESAEQAVKRELKEELGAETLSLRYFCSFPNEYKYSGLSVFTTDLAFFAEINNPEAITPMDDISAIEFIAPEELNMNELPSVSMKNIVREVVQLRKNDKKQA